MECAPNPLTFPQTRDIFFCATFNRQVLKNRRMGKKRQFPTHDQNYGFVVGVQFCLRTVDNIQYHMSIKKSSFTFFSSWYLFSGRRRRQVEAVYDETVQEGSGKEKLMNNFRTKNYCLIGIKTLKKQQVWNYCLSQIRKGQEQASLVISSRPSALPLSL